MNPIEPTAPLQVTLQAQQWNQVMAALSEAPYRVAAPLIQAIGGQLEQQAEGLPAAKPNGAETQPDAVAR